MKRNDRNVRAVEKKGLPPVEPRHLARESHDDSNSLNEKDIQAIVESRWEMIRPGETPATSPDNIPDASLREAQPNVNSPSGNHEAIIHYPYTRTQELCNAVSMMAPSLVIAWHYLVANARECFWHEHTLAFATGTLLHLPFSLSYHLMCAYEVFEDRVDNKARKLDQTFIHVCCVFYSFALGGVGMYCLGCTVLHLWYIFRLWMPGSHDHPKRRRRSVIIGMLLYTLPMAWRGDLRNYTLALMNGGSAVVSGYSNVKLEGWGHTTAHVLIGGFAHVLLQSAAGVPGPVCLP